MPKFDCRRQTAHPATRRRLLKGAALRAALTTVLMSGGCAPSPDLSVSAGYIKRPAPGAKLSVGYGVLTNNADRRICIEGFSSSIAGAIELHETREVDGRSRMRHLKTLCLAPGERTSLEPGGKHLMLFRLNLPEADTPVGVELLEPDGTRHPARFELVAFNTVR